MRKYYLLDSQQRFTYMDVRLDGNRWTSFVFTYAWSTGLQSYTDFGLLFTVYFNTR